MSAPDHGAIAREQGAARAGPEADALARIAELLGIVWRLRDEDGCPWDRAQTVESMAKNLVEEAAETNAAIAARDDAHIAEELGDTLMNVLLIARIAEQGGRFDIARVAEGIATKLVRRHPHVFGDRQAKDPTEALASWNESKADEGKAGGALDGVPSGLPALLAALKIGDKAAGVGFDWPHEDGALAKLDEELAELRSAVRGGDPARVEEELGDVLFAAVNVARKTGVDPELALYGTIEKFRRRFAVVERALGDRLGEASVEEMEKHWRAAAADEPPVLP